MALDAQQFSSAKRRWLSLVLAWIGIFTAQIQFSLLSSTIPPHLKKLDPQVSDGFIAWAVTAFGFAQMFSSPLLGWWSNRIRQCRLPAAVGLGLIILGNVGYCCLEAFPVPYRKWAMLFFRFVVGIGAGTPGLLRGYCATASVPKERTAAVTGSTAAHGLAVIVGPGTAAAFAPLGVNGLAIGGFHLHAYNAPALFAIIIAIVQIILLYTVFIEEYPGLLEALIEEKDIKDTILPPCDKLALWGQAWQWIAIWTTLVNFVICGPGYSMVMFGWTQSESIVYNGAITAVFGIISLIIYVLYGAYGTRLPERDVIILGTAVMTLFSVITFPYPTYPTLHAPSNATNSTLNAVHWNSTAPGNGTSKMLISAIIDGCDTKRYSWCFVVPHVPMFLYLSVFVLLAVSFPTVSCAISSLMPKLIGPRRQGTWQGVLIGAGGLARSSGPLLLSYAFIWHGPTLAWGIAIGIGLSGVATSLALRHRNVPLKIAPMRGGSDPNKGIRLYKQSFDKDICKS